MHVNRVETHMYSVSRKSSHKLLYCYRYDKTIYFLNDIHTYLRRFESGKINFNEKSVTWHFILKRLKQPFR